MEEDKIVTGNTKVIKYIVIIFTILIMILGAVLTFLVLTNK